MPNVSFKMSAAAERKLKETIARQAGTKIRTIVTDLHKSILARTPFNTGRTLGSWAGSAGTPMWIDIGVSGGFEYGTGVQFSNKMAVGSEPGRESFVGASLKSTEQIPFEKSPYQIFFISNGAQLDSGDDFAPGIYSGLPQGRGSRAYAQEYGYVANYDLFHDRPNVFSPRGTWAVQLAVDTIRLKYGRK